MRSVRATVLTLLAPLTMMVGVICATPSAASANTYYNFQYCYFDFGPGQSCPPNGVETWMHIEFNYGYAHGEEHEVCVENWYTEFEKFSEPKCAIHAGHIAEQEGLGLYGYARVWNGGKVTHIVEGQFVGYKTK